MLLMKKGQMISSIVCLDDIALGWVVSVVRMQISFLLPEFSYPALLLALATPHTLAASQ